MQYNVGDRVRRKGTDGENFCKVRDIGTILAIDNSNCPILIEWDSGKIGWNCESYLELVARKDRERSRMNKEDTINKIVAALRMTQSQLTEIVNLIETYRGILLQ